ncbi:hypothetical protein MTO96_046794 [Rhipicephalus appendiculatus]
MRTGNSGGDCLIQTQALYRALCAEGTRTLLILRDAQEINNNPLQSGSKAKTPVSATKPWPRIVPLDHTASYSDRRTQPRTEEGNVVPDSGGGGRGADNGRRA